MATHEINKINNFNKINISPKVSVIIPAYQADKWVGQAIDSVLTQTFRDFELIVVNDGSTDRTEEVIKSYGDKLTYVRNEKNMGIAVTRNNGVRAAKGEFIAFCSADDAWEPNFLEVMLEAERINPNKIYYCSYFVCDPNMNIIQTYAPANYNNQPHEDFCIASWAAAEKNTMFVNFSCIFVPRYVFDKVMFDEELRFGEDLQFLLWSMKDFRYFMVGPALVKYRTHPQMFTSLKLQQIPENNARTLEKARKYWRKDNAQA